jgi:RNA polymerase sigma factor (sigma-70 family)
MTVHSCVDAKGKGPGCDDCPVMVEGFCQELVDFIRRADNGMKKRYPRVSKFDRLSIIGDTVISILARIENFKGESQFSTWAWSICHNKSVDFFRKIERAEKIGEYLEFAEHSCFGRPDQNLMIEAEIAHIKILLHKNPDCSKLVIFYYHRKVNRGESQNEMAANFGMKPNSFNQKLKRCRKVLKMAIHDDRK